jgi:hypothetical protein
MRRNPSVTFLGLAVLALCVSSCNLDDRINNMGSDVTADLIVYFKTGTTQQQIDNFWNNVLSYPDRNGRGQFLRPGVGRLSRVESVEGHEGIAVIFYWDAWPSQRATLRGLIDASPIMFVVLEDIAPGRVKTLKRG